MNIKFEIPTWDEVYGMLLNLAAIIRKENYYPDIIVGISRGGWLPARVMSDLLENPKLANVRVEFYSDIAERKSKPLLTQKVSIPVNGKKVLLVDDVVDTGKSILIAKEHLLSKGAIEVHTATIYYKPWSIIKPDYCGKKTNNWVIFPWERKETMRYLIRNHGKKGISNYLLKEKLIEGGMYKDLVERLFNEIMEESY